MFFKHFNSKSHLIIAALILISYAITAAAAVIDVTSYGATGDGVTNDTDAITLAVAALSNGDTLLFPQSSLYYKVASDSHFTITESGIKVLIHGHIKAFGAPSAEKYIFNVVWADCAFIGQGKGAIIEGSGEYLYQGGHEAPALIRFTGGFGCSVASLTLRNGPAYSVSMRGSSFVEISDCVFQGGPLLSGNAHHGIYFLGAESLLIKGNRFIPDASGGMAHEWLGSSSTASNMRVTITDNYFEGAHDHAIYCSGLFNSVIVNNRVENTGSMAIKTIGSNNVIMNNQIYNAMGGGIEIRNSSGTVVANNLLTRHGYIEASPYNNYSGELANNIIEGNVLATPGCWGIVIWSSATVSGSKVSDNVIIQSSGGSANAGIKIWSTQASYDVTVSGNTLDECDNNGIYLSNIHNSLVSDNIINVPTGRTHVYKASSTGITETDNIVSYY